MKLTTIILSGSILAFTACGGGGSGSTADTNTSTPDATSITHNGTTYGFVTSPYTGKVWLDRNLGAAEVCAGFDDAACYGDYYQWGRGYDGHQESNSGLTDVQATNVTDVGHGDFITLNANNNDWAKDADNTGSRRALNWSKTDGTSVCPIGFRVPNITELRAETLANGVTDNVTAFTNFLKLSSVGFRSRSDGSMNLVGSSGNVWASSSLGLSNASFVGFDTGNAGGYSANRADGLSVRCLRD